MKPKAQKKRKPKVFKVKAWADVGSHGGIFAFCGGGECARLYEGMLHIYNSKHSNDLVEVEITYKI